MPRILLAQSEPADATIDAGARVVDGFNDTVRGFLEQVPQILLAIVVLVLFVLLGRAVAYGVRRTLSKATDRSDSFLNVMSRLSRSATVFLGFLIAIVLAFPTVNVATLVGGLGISSIAIGFAFQDILQNTLAGLLLLFRQPFEIGDQIEVQDHIGTVEAITIRETRLKRFDGQRILIPNSDVYSSSVRVQTAFDRVRSVIAVGVDYDADLSRAREVALAAVAGVSGVLEDPAPQALYTQLGTSTIDFDLRYWSGSTQAEIRQTQDQVVEAVTDALNAADIAMPADIVELDARVSFADAVAKVRGGGEGRMVSAAPVPAPPS